MQEFAHVQLEIFPKGKVLEDMPGDRYYIGASEENKKKMIDGIEVIINDFDYFFTLQHLDRVVDSYRGYDASEFAVRDDEKKQYILTQPVFAVRFEILDMGTSPSHDEGWVEPYWSPTEWEMENGDRREHFELNFLEPIVKNLLPYLSQDEYKYNDGVGNNRIFPTRQVSCILKFETCVEESTDWETGYSDIDAIYSNDFEFIGLPELKND